MLKWCFGISSTNPFMKCGICKEEIIKDKRREHLRYHKLDDTLVEWIIETDDDLISLYEKN